MATLPSVAALHLRPSLGHRHRRRRRAPHSSPPLALAAPAPAPPAAPAPARPRAAASRARARRRRSRRRRRGPRTPPCSCLARAPQEAPRCGLPLGPLPPRGPWHRHRRHRGRQHRQDAGAAAQGRCAARRRSSPCSRIGRHAWAAHSCQADRVTLLFALCSSCCHPGRGTAQPLRTPPPMVTAPRPCTALHRHRLRGLWRLRPLRRGWCCRCRWGWPRGRRSRRPCPPPSPLAPLLRPYYRLAKPLLLAQLAHWPPPSQCRS